MVTTAMAVLLFWRPRAPFGSFRPAGQPGRGLVPGAHPLRRVRGETWGVDAAAAFLAVGRARCGHA